MRGYARHLAALTGFVALIGCGGGGGSPTGPGGSGNPGGGGGGVVGPVIIIGSNGAVSPSSLTINVGQAVTFTNNSNRTRNISSDPHPEHTDCQPVNAVNLLSPGQSKQTSAFSTARTCGFHDHDDPDNASMKGSITVR